MTRETFVPEFLRFISEYDRYIIAGHVKPDGDCIGSCLGLYNYIRDNMSDKTVKVYLQPISRIYATVDP